MPSRFLTMREVSSRVSLSKTEIYRRIKAGTFPRPTRLSPHRIAILESAIEEWIEAQLRSGNGGEQGDA